MKRQWIGLATVFCGLMMSVTAAAQECPGDLNDDGSVTVDEILTVVNAALTGCSTVPTSTPTQLLTATFTQPPVATPTPTRTATASRTPTPTPRFIDNGNGTITDTTTMLVWEKKSDDGGLHDKNHQDTLFSWSQSGSTLPNGTAFAFVNALNAANFAGSRNWRLPTLEELETIVDTGGQRPGRPAVPETFDTNCVPGCSITQCSCTEPINHWTSTPSVANNQQAWYVLFNTGQSGTALKILGFRVRAVRGGN